MSGGNPVLEWLGGSATNTLQVRTVPVGWGELAHLHSCGPCTALVVEPGPLRFRMRLDQDLPNGELPAAWAAGGMIEVEWRIGPGRSLVDDSASAALVNPKLTIWSIDVPPWSNLLLRLKFHDDLRQPANQIPGLTGFVFDSLPLSPTTLRHTP